MVKGTLGAKILWWHSTIKQAILLAMNAWPITCEKDVMEAIKHVKQNSVTVIQCYFATVQHHGIHQVEGSLMLYYDQLNVIGQHMWVAYPWWYPIMSVFTAGDTCQHTTPATISNTIHIEHPSQGQVHSAQAAWDPTPVQMVPDPTISQDDLGKTFTVKQLWSHSDWELWRKAWFKMLTATNNRACLVILWQFQHTLIFIICYSGI